MPDKTILIVDRDTASLNFLKHTSQEQRYSVLGTGSGREGLIFIWRDHPDLIIFHSAIQDISTEDFLQKLRCDPRSASIPIFALSSDPATEKKDTCLQVGCNEYMLKSREAVAALPEIVSRLLGNRKL